RPQPAAAMLLGRDAGAEPSTDHDAVAEIAGVTERMRGNGLGHEGGAELIVMGVASRGEHDALAGGDRQLLAVRADARAGHALAIADDVDDRCVEEDGNAALAQAVEKASNQGISHRDPRAARIAQAIGKIAYHQPG